MTCFNRGEVGHLIHACPGKNKKNSATADDLVDNVSEPVEAGPSNVAPPVTEAGAVEDRAGKNDFSSCSYEVDYIKLFLRVTKNKRGVHLYKKHSD